MKAHLSTKWFAACATALTMSVATAGMADDASGHGALTVVDKLAFPEAPLFVANRLHWVEYASNRLMRLDGEDRKVVHEQDGCGHNGLALSPDALLVVICYESNEILYLEQDGSVVERIGADVNGEAFDHPNDIVFMAQGGAYVTTSGPFTAESDAIVGGVYFRAPGAGGFTEVADDIHFANGIAVIHTLVIFLSF